MTLLTQYRNHTKNARQTNHKTIFIGQPINIRAIRRSDLVVVETDPKQANTKQTIYKAHKKNMFYSVISTREHAFIDISVKMRFLLYAFGFSALILSVSAIDFHQFKLCTARAKEHCG